MKISAKLKFFLLNLVAAVIVVVVIGIIVLFKLDSYTHHGESKRTMIPMTTRLWQSITI